MRLSTREFQAIVGLQIVPELGRRAERLAQLNRRFRRNLFCPGNDLADGLFWAAKDRGKITLCPATSFQFLFQDSPRQHKLCWMQFVSCGPLSDSLRC